MNQKTVLAFVAIIVTVGLVITASTIATPASALKLIVREKDTRSNPNREEKEVIRRSIKEVEAIHLVYNWNCN